MIVGIGVDVVNVAKFGANVSRTPGFAGTLFTGRELVDEAGEQRTFASLAGRYAAKVAVAKALGVPPGMQWHDAQILVEPDGRPYVSVTGELAEAAGQLGVRSWHLSLAMEGDFSIAYVVAEGESSLAGAQPPAMAGSA